MPTYTYLCEKCKRTAQESKSIGAMSRPMPRCPDCGWKMGLMSSAGLARGAAGEVVAGEEQARKKADSGCRCGDRD